MKKVLLSAVQPSNNLTIGNYLGAIKGWVEMQAEYDCLFFAVDLHAITVRQDPGALRGQTYMALATYLAAGIDPKTATVFVQSHVPEHAELGWILTCFASMGELSRMTQYKDKTAKIGDNEGIGSGLFNYPVLMAADILLYGTHMVPVGEDQRQHVELARDLAARVNRFANDDLFVIPKPLHPKVGARIMSLQDPTKKMSKSDDDPGASIFLMDSDDSIVKKLKRAVTDSETTVLSANAKPGVMNLLNINAAVTGRTVESVIESFVGKGYGHLKAETADAVVATIRPLRTRITELCVDRGYLNEVLRGGAEKASLRARETLDRVHERMGFIPR